MVFARVFTYMATVLCFCTLAVLVGAPPAIHLLTTPDFYGAIQLVPVLTAAYLARALGDFFRAVFLAQGKPIYDALCNWIGAVVCLIGYFVLIPYWGTMGAAVATLLSFSVVGVASVYGAARVWPFRLEGARLMKLGAMTTILVGIHLWLPPASVPGEILWGLLLLAVFVGFWILMLLRPEEKELIVSRVAGFFVRP
jgi:O-antigen/teichoic acid export membrane protein